MDKYEYNLKLEEIDKLVDRKDYEAAAKLADTIDWRRVRNVRTLCLISEIYEAAGRLEDSKTLLLRTYRRSPMGRTVLYRLVEVTTALRQYDEAMEYCTEYMQAAPNDNNKYILKYEIYKGRGSSAEEQIAILEEYLGQEYTERWAYELAKLYQKSGQIQKCLATCDDLVLWFHSGKYVMKALELKKKYAALTPKQQQIYEQHKTEEIGKAIVEKEPEPLLTQEGEVLAETIMAQTEKEIANEITAHKEQLQQEEPEEAEEIPEPAPETGNNEEPEIPVQKPELPEEVVEEPAQVTEQKPFSDVSYDEKNLQMELARSMREIISGVVKHEVEEEEDLISVSREARELQEVLRPAENARTESAGDVLSIDDILLSMGERGRMLADSIREENAKLIQAEAAAGQAEKSLREPEERKEDERLLAEDVTAIVKEMQQGLTPSREEYASRKSVMQVAEEDLSEAEKEALQYTDNPEKVIRNRRNIPTYREEQEKLPDQENIVRNAAQEEKISLVMPEDLQKTRRIEFSREELQRGILTQKTKRLPDAEMSAALNSADKILEELVPEDPGPVAETESMSLKKISLEVQRMIQEETARSMEMFDAAQQKEEASEISSVQELPTEEAVVPDVEEMEKADLPQETPEPERAKIPENVPEPQLQEAYPEENAYIPSHLRYLFDGFTDVQGLEYQINNAILQAVSRGDDRTSRTGNILIFGAHACGKTALAMNLAKAVAEEKGNESMKIARIYAADFNRKDIAATIAKIAGGALIIEEAGDLEDHVIEQLTTAMEFRTDGLLVILEDEQKYIMELLKRHTRFTMKFTAQIYIPDYSSEELVNFAQIMAAGQDCVISEDGQEALLQKISEKAEKEGEGVSLTELGEIVNAAVAKSNKFLRKLFSGRKRYDENDYVILRAKDFR